MRALAVLPLVLVTLAAQENCGAPVRDLAKRLVADSSRAPADTAASTSTTTSTSTTSVRSIVLDSMRFTLTGTGVTVEPVRDEAAARGDAPTAGLSAEQAVWKPVKTWSDDGFRNTERFRVGTPEWRVIVEGAPTRDEWMLRASVYGAGGRRLAYEGGDNVRGDTIYLSGGPGVFWIAMNAGSVRWTVRAEEKHLPAERVNP
jgi:hypothetical protein